MSTAAQTLLALLLFGAVGLKLRDRGRAADALATYGLGPAAARRAALALLVVAELALAAALMIGVGWAPAAAGVLFGLLALVTLAALLAGRAGRPCACFGATARLTRTSPVAALIAAGLALALATHTLGGAPSHYARVLTAVVTVSAVAIVALALTVLALAREIGVLRLSIAGQGALELTDEGPPLGERQVWAGEIPQRGDALLSLAIFSSQGCPMCRQLQPAVNYVAADPLLAVRVFDEVAEAATWAAAAVPGSPYAVALDGAGVTLAKGTFNSLVQLESIIATARARQGQALLVG